MWLQLFVLGLPIIPGCIDCYLQAKFKQYVINPIANALYLLFVESIRVVLTALYLVIWTIGYYIVVSFQVITSDLLWGIKHFWWYTTWLGSFIKLFLYNVQVIVTIVFWWTIEDIRWIINCVCDLFIWSYTLITYMWDTALQFLWNNLQAAAIYVWHDIAFFFTIMWFVFKLAVLAIFSGLTIYLAVIIYRFFSRRDFALQCEYYFGPTPPGRNQGQGVLTITPVMLDTPTEKSQICSDTCF